jgi:GT2 family glycosyltransferase
MNMDLTPAAISTDQPENGSPDSLGTTSPASARDVENSFVVFLGRRPGRHPSDLQDSEDILALVGRLVGGDEFEAQVLGPLLLREALPHAAIDEVLPLVLIDWAQLSLPICADTRRAIGGSRTWAQLLELLLSDETLAQASPRLQEANIDGILRTRLEKEPLSKTKHSVVGAVDSASAFEVRGWAVDLCDKSVPVILEFLADGVFIGTAICNESRPDVQDCVGGTGNFGFTFRIATSHRLSFAGGRTLKAVASQTHSQIGESVVVYSDAARSWDVIADARKEIAEVRKICERIEARLPEIGRTASVPTEAYSEYWERFYRLSPDTIAGQRDHCRSLGYRPLISVIVPTWTSDTRLLDKALRSLKAQSYDNWEVVITDDASDSDELRSLLRRYSGDSRIRCIESAERGGIAINTNRGIEAARGEYIAFLDQDDELAKDALYSIVLALQERRYRLIYSDEDRIDEDELGKCVHHTPFFKPDFDPDLLLAQNYICHLVVLRRDVIDEAGGFHAGLEGAQDHDLLLRVVEKCQGQDIHHVQRVLYHWRVNRQSFSNTAQNTDAIQKNIVLAVADHLKRRDLSATVEEHADPVGTGRQFATRVRWSSSSLASKVSIIIATRDGVDLLRPCIESVLGSIENSPVPVEILLVDNDSIDPATLDYMAGLSSIPAIRRLCFRGAFNWSAINNTAAAEATGDVVIFLNNDTVVLTKDWCLELVTNAMRPDVGAVGARLLYADGTIQHAGVVVGIEGVAGHECVGETPEAGGYFGRGHLLRSAAAVTGACMATRRSLFQQMDGGFDELNLKVAFSDIDYCMRVREAGFRVVYNPFAVLCHLESKSRGRELTQAQKARHHAEALRFRARWGDADDLDPYYNLHFERYARPFDRLRPPPNLFHPAMD